MVKFRSFETSDPKLDHIVGKLYKSTFQMAIRNCFEPEHSIMSTSFLRAMCDNIRDSGYFKIRKLWQMICRRSHDMIEYCK